MTFDYIYIAIIIYKYKRLWLWKYTEFKNAKQVNHKQ